MTTVTPEELLIEAESKYRTDPLFKARVTLAAHLSLKNKRNISADSSLVEVAYRSAALALVLSERDENGELRYVHPEGG